MERVGSVDGCIPLLVEAHQLSNSRLVGIPNGTTQTQGPISWGARHRLSTKDLPVCYQMLLAAAASAEHIGLEIL